MTKGNIYTFYSYKGGVGRTFALANIGALLCRWGYRVLCIDWDLEAPGLHLYFQRWLKQTPEHNPGLTELIQDYVDKKQLDWRDYTQSVNLPGAKRPLTLMAAGRLDKTYVQRMQALNWTSLYEEHDFGRFLEDLRSSWKDAFDFILVDSRTGISDIGGICTVQLPDSLVLLFTANDQSLYGSIDIVERARRARAELVVDRAKLLVLPVATRFEGRVEYELASYWLSKFEQELAPLYMEWSHRDVRVADLLNFTRIPYVAYWSFGEKLPVIEKGTKDTDDIGFSLETLAAFVAHQFAKSDLLVRNRDNFVAQAAKKDLRVRRPLNVFISYAHRDLVLAEELMMHLSPLKRSKIINLWTDSLIEPGEKWYEEMDKQLETADIAILLVSADFLASDYIYSSEMQRFLARQEAGKVIVIPVLLRPTYWRDTPFSNLQVLPSNAVPITSWSNRDEAFANVVQGISEIIENAEDYT